MRKSWDNLSEYEDGKWDNNRIQIDFTIDTNVWGIGIDMINLGLRWKPAFSIRFLCFELGICL